ncbi:uncharacterized protein LOC119585420 [Penaeus monodon]|uniref:uncharacterized protein LOC119585420 n=1 Tax=Penaeus monodon TaxID=6687 RepID=UPI0018A7983A|nr:uncharacterized protein LOC119585420 [Penaeus monodon]
MPDEEDESGIRIRENCENMRAKDEKGKGEKGIFILADEDVACFAVSGVQVVVVVLAVVLVTAVVSCVLGNSKMGARLWSERRSSRAAHPTSASPHAHTAVTPTAFTHSNS